MKHNYIYMTDSREIMGFGRVSVEKLTAVIIGITILVIAVGE